MLEIVKKTTSQSAQHMKTLATNSRRPNTQKQYRNIMERFKKFVGSNQIDVDGTLVTLDGIDNITLSLVHAIAQFLDSNKETKRKQEQIQRITK